MQHRFHTDPSSNRSLLKSVLEKAEETFNDFNKNGYKCSKEWMKILQAIIIFCNGILRSKEKPSTSVQISLYFTLAEAYIIACQICLKEKKEYEAIENYEKALDSCTLAELVKNQDDLNPPLNMAIINQGNSFKFEDIQQPKKFIYENLSPKINKFKSYNRPFINMENFNADSQLDDDPNRFNKEQ